MIRILILFVMVFYLGGNVLQAQIQEDKILHFSAGAISGAAGALVASELTDQNRFWTVTGSVAASLLVGLAKEAIDQKRSSGWDNGDLAATVLGGLTVGVSIELFSKKNGRSYKKRKKIKENPYMEDGLASADELKIKAPVLVLAKSPEE